MTRMLPLSLILPVLIVGSGCAQQTGDDSKQAAGNGDSQAAATEGTDETERESGATDGKVASRTDSEPTTRKAMKPASKETSADSTELAKRTPQNVTTLLDNDYVLVQEFVVAPYEELPSHEGHDRVVYAFSDYDVEYTEKGEPIRKTWQAGQAHWHAAGTHAVKVVGETQARFLVVSRKPGAPFEKSPPEDAQPLSEVAPERLDVLLDNEHAMVYRVQVPPGEKLPWHRGVNRAVYSLSEYEARYQAEGGEPIEKKMTEGSVSWHSADKHMLDNISDRPAESLIVGFKK